MKKCLWNYFTKTFFEKENKLAGSVFIAASDLRFHWRFLMVSDDAKPPERAYHIVEFNI